MTLYAEVMLKIIGVILKMALLAHKLQRLVQSCAGEKEGLAIQVMAQATWHLLKRLIQKETLLFLKVDGQVLLQMVDIEG